MCTLTIPVPDEILTAVKMDQDEAIESMKIAFACQMFKDHRLPLWRSAQLCGMNKIEFAGILTRNKIPVIDYSAGELEREVAMLGQMLEQKLP
jgi:predicted HTH domain antitoxin